MRRIFITASLIGGALCAVTLTGLARNSESPAFSNPLFQGAEIEPATLALFQRACQNCHSENTQWPWYSKIPPASWMMRKDVGDARRHVNFSNWDSYKSDKQEEFLTRIGSVVRTGQMPLPRYTLLHKEARLTSQERQVIYEWTRAEKKRLRSAGGRNSSVALDQSPAATQR